MERASVRGGSLGRKLMAFALAVTMALPFASALPSGSAVADEVEAAAVQAPAAVAGVDFMQPGAEAWEVLRVDGASVGDAVYLTVSEGSTVLAHRQKYVFSDEVIDESTGAQIAQIVALNLGEGVTPASQLGTAFSGPRYQISAYATGVELPDEAPLFEGTVYPVYAKLLDGSGNVAGYELLGIRTVSGNPAAASRAVGAGETYYQVTDGVAQAFELVRSSGSDNAYDAANRAFVVTYQPTAAESVTGSVTYVDAAGNVVRTDSVPGIAGEGKVVSPEKSFFADGEYYRVIGKLYGEVKLTPAYANHVVRVMKVNGADAQSYQVTIKYVCNEDGSEELLWSDTVDVKGAGYQYTLPTVFSTNAKSGVQYYTLDAVQGSPVAGTAAAQSAEGHSWANPLKLDGSVPASAFGTENGKRTLTVNYQSQEADKLARLTVVEMDGVTGARLGTWTGDITPETEAVYPLQNKEIDGTTYVPWAGHGNSIVYGWDDLKQGIDLMQYVYFVPEDYVADASYDVTVRYVNIANNSVLRTDTLTVSPDMNDYLTIAGEARFTQGGNTYVRLDGQEAGVRHSYYTPTRTYTVYYRDVNDTINADTVIYRTQIIETERTVEVPGTTTTTLTAAPVAAVPPADAGTVEAGVGAGDGATIINDDENPLASLDGVDTTTERTIEENGNPLGAGVESDFEDLFSNLHPGVLAGVVVALLGVAAAMIFLWMRRKNRKQNEMLAETGTWNE